MCIWELHFYWIIYTEDLFCQFSSIPFRHLAESMEVTYFPTVIFLARQSEYFYPAFIIKGFGISKLSFIYLKIKKKKSKNIVGSVLRFQLQLFKH